MLICDTGKLHKIVDDFCIEKRPKSIDIHHMIHRSMKQKDFLKPKNHTENMKEVDAKKLEMASSVLSIMLDNMRNISFKKFIEYYMYLWDITEADLLDYMTEEIDD